MSQTVFVAMSGGVDSSVTAALLKQQGYKVVGVYMKNWSQDLPGFICPWREDYQDVKRVSVQLGIDLRLYDFETEYRHKVVDYMVAEYRAGRTPNPDIMCNQEVKFKLFLDTALEDGADLIATGHYARIASASHLEAPQLRPGLDSVAVPRQAAKLKLPGQALRNEPRALFKGLDENKDQSYFLYRITEKALNRSLMPVGEMSKPRVRQIASKLRLVVADKKDSQGICFVGKVGIKEFLLNELGEQPRGPIIDQTGKEIGQHDGAIFYTIGQRHGLDVGGGLPYYVSRKDMKTNSVYVTSDLDDHQLWVKTVNLESLHWINQKPISNKSYQVRLRYRGPLLDCRYHDNMLSLDAAQRSVAAGQSAVIYDGERVVGGGIIS